MLEDVPRGAWLRVQRVTRLEQLERQLRERGHDVRRDYQNGRWTVDVDGARVAEGACIGDLEAGLVAWTRAQPA